MFGAEPGAPSGASEEQSGGGVYESGTTDETGYGGGDGTEYQEDP